MYQHCSTLRHLDESCLKSRRIEILRRESTKNMLKSIPEFPGLSNKQVIHCHTFILTITFILTSSWLLVDCSNRNERTKTTHGKHVLRNTTTTPVALSQMLPLFFHYEPMPVLPLCCRMVNTKFYLSFNLSIREHNHRTVWTQVNNELYK